MVLGFLGRERVSKPKLLWASRRSLEILFLLDMGEESVLQLLLMETSWCRVGCLADDPDPSCFATQLNDVVPDPLNVQALRRLVKALAIRRSYLKEKGIIAVNVLHV